ncbi:DNA cytosine methyltransferase [Nocardia sp. NPDC003183]
MREISRLRSLELCAGAGGSALGLEQAGFDPVVLVEDREIACQTLSLNRPNWDVRDQDLLKFEPGVDLRVDVDLLSAGLPRVKSSATASRGRSNSIEFELLKKTVQLVVELQPRAVLIENVAILAEGTKYLAIRESINEDLKFAGYEYAWLVVNAMNFGVPQDRASGILIAFRDGGVARFHSELRPVGPSPHLTVGTALRQSMGSGGWVHADAWAAYANEVAPTIVGGSYDRGGPDLGLTGSKAIWAQRFAVNGSSVGNEYPGPGFAWDPSGPASSMVKLTLDQVAILQGFPSNWMFAGKKTNQYRQLGNATPPPLARALGVAVRATLNG